MDINLRGVIHGTQAAYQIMLLQGFGHIVNTASIAGLIPVPGKVSYASTKHAIVGLSSSLRAEGALKGIRVSVLCPGFVRTALFNKGGKYGKDLMGMSAAQEKKALEMIEKFRPMSPDVFSRKALNQIAANKAIIVLPSWYKIMWWFNRLFPALSIQAMQYVFSDSQKQISNAGK